VRKIITAIFALVLFGGMGAIAWQAGAAEEPAKTEEAAPAEAAPADAAHAAAGGECCKPGDTTPPLDLIKATPKGGLHNPYNDDVEAAAAEAKKVYGACIGCHGGGGGGGMCPPLTNDTWVYGGDDDTLFRLIALGSDGLQKEGYKRVKSEIVVGPMPPFGNLIKTSDDIWKAISFIRSKNPGSMKLVDKPAQ
jgi:mono/diheme cytochrome c family protein